MRKHQMICLALILLAVVAEGALLGGWTKIKDVSDPNVVEIAKFAIAEHKKQSKVDLVYEKVVAGKTQVVSGIKYNLIIAAKYNGVTKNYEAVVWAKSWANFKKLESFKSV